MAPANFTFENCKRYMEKKHKLKNAHLESRGLRFPGAQKTGTTICGVVFKDGVILGADTRATGGDIVSDKNCVKIHKLAPNMLCCGAGTAADCNKVTEMMESQLKLFRLNSGRQVSVATAERMLKQYLFKYQGYVGAYLVLGGVDSQGPHLVDIHSHGSSLPMPFTALGSGMMAAIAVLESGYKAGLEEEEAKRLVADAVRAGILNDMGSGSNIDLAIIKAGDKVEYLRNYEKVGKQGERRKNYKYDKGTTEVLSEETRSIEVVEETIRPVPMDTE